MNEKDYVYTVDLSYVKSNCKPGWILNPKEKVVNGIIKGINRNNGHCPCANTSEDTKCPCSNYRNKDHCCCTLYIKESTHKENEND